MSQPDRSTGAESHLREALDEAVPRDLGPLDVATIRGRASRARRRRTTTWTAAAAAAVVAAVGLATPALTGAGGPGREEGRPATPGAGQVVVPVLTGMPVAEAARIADGLGLLLDAGDVAVESPGHVVLDQTPAADSVVARGTTVTLEAAVAGGPARALLTVRNRTGAEIWVEDDYGRSHVEPGKTVAYASRRACGAGPFRAIGADGLTLAVHEAECRGETWELRPGGKDVVLAPGAGGSASQGDAAVWDVRRGAEVDGASASVPVEVRRLGCNSGVTGAVLEPTVEYGSTEVVVTFQVEADTDGGDCQGNDGVPYDVVLTEPLGDRVLVDGQCLPGREAATTSHCSSGGVRSGP